MSPRTSYGVAALVLVGGTLAGVWWTRRAPAEIDGAAREDACRRDPPDVEACAASGTARLLAGDLDSAREHAARALQAAPDDLHARLLDAAIDQAAGKPEAAAAKYEALEKSHPESGLPAANLSLLALERKDLAGASAAVDRALQKDASLAMAHAMKARILEAKGDRAGALAEMESAVTLDPGALETRLELADMLAGQGKGAERLKLLRETVALAPGEASAHLGYGQALEQAGDLLDAANELRAAEDLAPKDPRIGVALARVRLEQGKPDFAVPRLKEILERNPDSVEARLLLASGLHAQGADPEALEQLGLVLDRKNLAPGDRMRALRTRARVRAAKGELSAAIADYDALLAEDPANGPVHAEKAHLLLDAGRYDDAAPDLEAANTKGFPSSTSMLDQARYFAHTGHDAQAIETLKALLAAHRFDADQVRAQPELKSLEGKPEYDLLFEEAKR